MAYKNVFSYIQKNTEVDVLKRAYTLYNKEAIKEATYNSKTKKWNFKVLGTKQYKVEIQEGDDNIQSSSCTCPYNYGGICKHQVAALLFIKNDAHRTKAKSSSLNKKRKTAVKKNKVGRRQGEPLKIPAVLTNKYISKFIKLDVVPEYILNSLFKFKTSFGDNFIEFESSVGNKNKIRVYSKDNDVYIQSITSKYSVPFGTPTQDELLVLFYVFKSKMPELFEYYFFDKLFDKKKQELLKSYGFPLDDDFDKYFKISFDYEGLKYYMRNEYKGLISKFSQNKLTDLLNDLTSEDVNIKMPKLSNKEERQIGFVIKYFDKALQDFYDKDYYDDDFEDDIVVPIIAKPNKKKDKLLSNFEIFDDEDVNRFKINITDNQKQIIKEIDKGLDDIELLLNTYKYLSKEKFVYIYEDELYRIVKRELTPVKVSENPAKLKYKVYQNDKFIKAEAYFVFDDAEMSLKDFLKSNFQDFILNKNTLYVFDNKFIKSIIKQKLTHFMMPVSKKQEFVDTVLLKLSKQFEIDFVDKTYDYEKVELDFKTKQIYISEQDDYIIFKPQVVYGNDKPLLLNYEGDVVERQGEKMVVYKRNKELEQEFLQNIVTLHPKFEEQASNKILYLHYDDFVKDMWFFKFFEAMKDAKTEVYGLKELKKFKFSPHRGSVSTSITSGQDWFDVNVDVKFGEQSVNLKELKKAIVNKQNYILLNDGSFGVISKDWFEKFNNYFKHGEINKDNLRISKLKFSIIDELFDDIDDEKVLKELAQKKKLLQSFKNIEKTKIPKEITATLREYQKEGVNWLNFLHKMKWGGILADDMGLGKTIQILTFLQSINKRKKSANLIVVPTTLLFNWENEIKKFAPQLKYLHHYGSDRIKDTKHFKEYDIIFVTYGILLRDIEILKEYTFNYVILDESQAIKNPLSRRYKAAVLLNAKNKIAMTGTPIENSTFDLYAQMNFVNYGFMGSLKDFKDNYSNKIDKEGDKTVANELQRMINPFVLRRTKEQVATELPPKVEDIIYCEMETRQRKVYDAYKNHYRDKILNNIEKDGLNKSKFMVLDALTRLRQICDSPALLKDESITTKQAIKIKEIISQITEKTANHKILIFSQFVTMLHLIKDELDKLNITYEYLDGKSSRTQRQKSVENFQKDKSLRVFLISLKAGGTGLNLTAADYVYIVDPWWNPAVENQAIDRTYRIGQDKHVFAYRMICKDTIEEKIVELQSKKKQIAGDIIQTDEKIIKTIDINDIKRLFS